MKPIQWAKNIADDPFVTIHRIFCSSLSDIFDDEVPQEWRESLWNTIDVTNSISNGKIEWLLLTKRIENAKKMLPSRWLLDPWSTSYVRIGITAENDMRFRERLPILFDFWGSGKNFVSAEPLLGPIYLDEVSEILVDWMIVGGESGKGCRPMDIQWAVDIKDACKEMNIPFFMKQLGGYPDKRDVVDDWVDELQIREFPSV
jgi:protein gp37